MIQWLKNLDDETQVWVVLILIIIIGIGALLALPIAFGEI